MGIKDLLSSLEGVRTRHHCSGGFMDFVLVESAKVMAKGQITLPKDIRDALGVRTGDRVTLISKGDHVIMMNSTIYAMKVLQTGMTGEAEKAGLHSEEDVITMIARMRREDNE